MKGPGLTIRSLSWLSAILLLVVLVLVNLVFARTVVRVDMTEQQIYTLSEGTRRILGRLEDPATVKVFWHGIPAELTSARRYLHALLEEMQGVAGDMLKVQWVDMEDDAGKAEAARYQVEEWSFGTSSAAGERRLTQGYMSFVVEMGEQKPAVFNAFFTYEEQLEFMIATALAQRSDKNRTAIALVGDRPAPSPFAQGPTWRFSKLERRLEEALGTDLRTYVTLDEPIPDGVGVLFLLAPRNLEARQVYHVEQFVLRGGHLLVYLDPAHVQNVYFSNFGAEPDLSGLEEWLGHLGVTVERGVVGDFDDAAITRAYPVPAAGGGAAREVRAYPYWFHSLEEQHEATSPITGGLPAVMWFWPAPLTIDEARQQAAGRTARVLVRTTSNGYRRPDLGGLNRALEEPGGKSLESVPLMVLLEGPMTSFWKDKPIPGTEPPAGKEGEDAASDAADAAADPGPEGTGGDPAAPPPAPAPGEDGPPPADDPAPAEEPAPPEDPAPPEGDGDEAPDATEEAPAKEPPARPAGHRDEGSGRILVATDADFVSDVFGPQTGWDRRFGLGAWELTLRALGALGGDQDLLDVPLRTKKARLLERQEAADERMLRLVNIAGVPLLMLLIGLTVFIVRRS